MFDIDVADRNSGFGNWQIYRYLILLTSFYR